MRKLILIIFLLPLLLHSCQIFDKQVPSKEELLKKELEAINWKEVDEYPSFNNCDSVQKHTIKTDCFFEYLTRIIQEKLSTDTVTVLYPELDTLCVKVTVFPNSTMEFETQLKDSLSYSSQKIDSILHARLVDFPRLNPAIKRGIRVKTEYVLPVILKIE